MGIVLTASQLTQRVKDYAKMIWGMEVNIPIEISTRMTHTYGYFRYKRTGQPVKLVFAEELIAGQYKPETLDSIIKHELAHMKLFIDGMPHSDGDWAFKKELARIGAHRTGIIERAGMRDIMKCSCCGKEWGTSERRARDFNKKYITSCCRAKAIHLGKRYVSDTNEEVIAQDKNLIKLYAEYTKKDSEIQTYLGTRTAATKSPEPTAKVITTGSIKVANSIKIEDILEQTKRISNKQMIPAMKTAIDEKSKEKLVLLKKTYPEIFESSIKYVGEKRQEQLKNLI